MNLRDNWRWFEECSSTNEVATQFAKEKAPNGTVVWTKHQTQGRGRHGRDWQNLPGDNLTLSVLLRPQGGVADWAGFSLAVGLAGCRAIEAYAPTLVPHLKWPNDILLNGKKVGGILIESSSRQQTLEWMVVGIGINVQARDFPEDLRLVATSLALEGVDLPVQPLAEAFVDELHSVAQRFERQGIAGFVSDINNALDKDRWYVDERQQRGRQVGVTERGALRIETEQGRLLEVSAGELTWGNLL